MKPKFLVYSILGHPPIDLLSSLDSLGPCGAEVGLWWVELPVEPVS